MRPSRLDFGVVPLNVLLKHSLSSESTMQVAEWTVPRNHVGSVFVQIVLGVYEDHFAGLKPKYEFHLQWLV